MSFSLDLHVELNYHLSPACRASVIRFDHDVFDSSFKKTEVFIAQRNYNQMPSCQGFASNYEEFDRSEKFQRYWVVTFNKLE